MNAKRSDRRRAKERAKQYLAAGMPLAASAVLRREGGYSPQYIKRFITTKQEEAMQKFIAVTRDGLEFHEAYPRGSGYRPEQALGMKLALVWAAKKLAAQEISVEETGDHIVVKFVDGRTKRWVYDKQAQRLVTVKDLEGYGDERVIPVSSKKAVAKVFAAARLARGEKYAFATSKPVAKYLAGLEEGAQTYWARAEARRSYRKRNEDAEALVAKISVGGAEKVYRVFSEEAAARIAAILGGEVVSLEPVTAE